MLLLIGWFTSNYYYIHELWTCYCLLDDLATIIISPLGVFLFASKSCRHVTAYWTICLLLLLHPWAVNILPLIGWFDSNYYYIHELWICYYLLDDLPPIIIIISNELWTCYCSLDYLATIIISSPLGVFIRIHEL